MRDDMKNTINYYYNLNPNKINQIFNYYYFYIDNELYYFTIYNRNPKHILAIYEFNQKMLQNNILVNEILNNRTNTILTYVNQMPYLLFLAGHLLPLILLICNALQHLHFQCVSPTLPKDTS